MMVMDDNLKLLDCTLRDGGYINDWKFGNSTIAAVYDRLGQAGVDIIEIGFIDDRRQFDIDRTIQPNTECLSKVFGSVRENNSMIVAMIDYGTCDISNLQPCEETVLDGIRVIFKKQNMEGAVKYAEKIKEKGYLIFLNMVSITSYSDQDMLDFITMVNKIKPYAVSIVDTYGLMHREELFHYYDLLNYNLLPDINIGYHSHNNFQLAYSNTIELIKKKGNRGMIVDGTVYGMGKSAGNAPLELLAMYLNENQGAEYDINEILELIDTNILSIYREKYWGYSFQYYVSALNDCHPSYVSYLSSKKTLSMKSVNEILSWIEPDKKLIYDGKYAEQLYLKYQSRFDIDSTCRHELNGAFSGKSVLLIGPGHSILTERNKIEKFIDDGGQVVVSVNFLPNIYKTDYIFISNSKRYNSVFSEIRCRHLKVIATSNVTPILDSFDFVINYEKLVLHEDGVEDNALLMILNMLSETSPLKVFLAGFDGFSEGLAPNYYDDSMYMSADLERQQHSNAIVSKKIREFRKVLDIEFVTNSLYDTK
ncbi:3-hydroxy-3-methylglutaryl-CoA lyase [Candidatus Nomurabacteria bacterium]|nr:3-hydroxy-3-methylglutaryl-CoA lyase [Candidatus Nomurabacteria bacterium]